MLARRACPLCETLGHVHDDSAEIEIEAELQCLVLVCFANACPSISCPYGTHSTVEQKRVEGENVTNDATREKAAIFNFGLT